MSDGAHEASPAGAGSRSGTTGRLMAELWYDEVPDLTDPRLVQALQRVSPAAELQDGSVTVPHTELTMETEEGTRPLLTVVFAASELDGVAKKLPEVGQTWDWEEAEAALAGCRGSVLVSELLAELFTPQQRVSSLGAVVRVLVEETRPRAIHWPTSQRITDPAEFTPDGLDGPLNVRFFTVGHDDGASVMDSLGLQIFELPDVQCHFREVSPGEIAGLVYNTAVYLFEQGDVIDDGHTISGPQGDEHYVCRHEDALVVPARVVLDVDLGEPYGAGNRDRG